MKINKKFACRAQSFLELLSLDNMSAIYILKNDDIEEWQFAVEFIYRILTCNLATVSPEDILIKTSEFSYDGIEGYCKELAANNPLVDVPLVWIGSDIVLTPKGNKLLNEYIFQTDPSFQLNYSFIEALENIFEEYGIPWDEKNPIIPITTEKIANIN